MTVLGKLIASIGGFFAGLFKSTKKAFNELPQDQQDAIISGVNVSEIIKQGYQNGATDLITSIASKLNISREVAQGVLDHVLKSWGINEPDIQKGVESLAEAIENGLTDDGWNGLWESFAKFAASWLSTGRLSWVTLGLGVVEFVYQAIIKKVK